MRFYFDASVSFRIADALAILDEDGHRISHPANLFGDPAIKDEVFLPKLKADGDWIVITADRGRKDGNWHVWLASGLTVVFLKKAWTSLRLQVFTSRFLDHWHDLVREVDRYPRGTCFFMSKSGRLERVPRKHQR